MKKIAAFIILSCCIATHSNSQNSSKPIKNDANTWLHLMEADYKVPYGSIDTLEIKKTMLKVYEYLNDHTPATLVNAANDREITNLKRLPENVKLKSGDYRITHYEWGVTYAGMLLAGRVTNDHRYTDYAKERLTFINELYKIFRPQFEKNPKVDNPIPTVVNPRSLDDAGAMCFSMIMASSYQWGKELRPIIDGYIKHISEKQLRLPDGNFARNKPFKNSVWLDDLYMSVPALAQMSNLTGNTKFLDDAVRQVLRFSEKMFNTDKKLFAHGWIADMNTHPRFYWARANGWAVMTMVELMEVLPKEHPDRSRILNLLQTHIEGLAACQSGDGLWHQLLDKNDSYLETSASAIFVYSIARAINRGYIEKTAYASMVSLAWNALTTQVEANGQIKNTCVGTSLGFDPAYYYYRPVNVYAAHSYGPFLLAGAEMLTLLRDSEPFIFDTILHYKMKKQNAEK